MLRGLWTVLATGCTLAAIGLSMAMNFPFGYGLGTTEPNARILGALSVACDGLKAFLPLFIAWQWADRHRLAAVAGALLFALLLAYGTASAVGFAAENRAAFTGARESRSAALEDAVADLAAAEARLAGLPPHRIAGLIEAELARDRKDRLWDATGACTDATLAASRKFCQRIDTLQGELAVAGETARLATSIERLKQQVARRREVDGGRDADPQAKAIGQLTSLEAATVRSGLTWLLALAVEAISAFGLFAITRRSPRAATLPALQTAAPVLPEPRDDPGRPWRLVNPQGPVPAAARSLLPHAAAKVRPPRDRSREEGHRRSRFDDRALARDPKGKRHRPA